MIARGFRHFAGASAAFALLVAAMPAQAQFGILNRARDATNAAASGDNCGTGRSSNAGSRLMGSLLGGAARDAAGRAGVTSWVPVSDFTDQISTEIACKLDPQEQAQAAEATLTATRGTGADGMGQPEVGQMAAWTSNTRDDVSGTSTVSGRANPGRDGADCIMVTDVIIVGGEETRAEKRMCRAPGSARYSIVA